MRSNGKDENPCRFYVCKPRNIYKTRFFFRASLGSCVMMSHQTKHGGKTMYIIKNALRCIGRSKGRNLLIGIIALVIAVSACLGLSIRQAAESAKENALSGMNITATISYNRNGAMNNMFGGGGFPGGSGGGKFDRDQFADMMGSASSLTVAEYQKYAAAESVQDFYYTLTAYFNGADELLPVSDSTSDSDDSSDTSGTISGFPGGMVGMMGDFFGGMNASGDFSIIGYSSDIAMTDFKNGISSITDGTMFEEGTADRNCVISEELAIYNSLSVGSVIKITNANNEEELYELTVVGIYQSSESNDFSMSMFSTSQDPANRILMSAEALQSILDASAEASTTITDENGKSKETKTTGTLSATYVLADLDAYYAFEEEVRTLGLSDSYTVSSSDITSFENSITPLKTLGTMAGWFLIVILLIGAIILVVLNIFNVRERKYEIGVLTAMGMKKWKVATQFICEILVVTMIAIIAGAGIGAVCSVPVTNALLENQINSQNAQQSQINNNFGRPGNMGGGFPGGSMPDMGNMGGGMTKPGGNFMENIFGGAADYVTEIDSAMNLTVVFQMIGIGLLLTLIASAASVLFVMRYDPLKILSNRD